MKRRIARITAARERSAWINNEIFRLKRMGYDNQRIATHIQACERSAPEAVKMLSASNPIDGIVFPPNFTFSKEAARKRLHQILAGVDRRDVLEWQNMTAERCEAVWLDMQPGMRAGDPNSARAGLQALVVQGRALGFMVERAELKAAITHTDESVITREMLDRLSTNELAMLDYLIRKMHGKEVDVTPAPDTGSVLSAPTRSSRNANGASSSAD